MVGLFLKSIVWNLNTKNLLNISTVMPRIKSKVEHIKPMFLKGPAIFLDRFLGFLANFNCKMYKNAIFDNAWQ